MYVGTFTFDDMGVKIHRDKRMELKDLVREGDIDESKIADIPSSIKGLAVQHFSLGIEVTEQSLRFDREIIDRAKLAEALLLLHPICGLSVNNSHRLQPQS